MKRLTSTQVMGCGFAALFAVLVWSAYEASRLQYVGDEQQRAAYRRFIRQDNAITAARRTVWLGGIYSRDYFLDRSAAGWRRFTAHVEELERSGLESLNVLRETSPGRLAELKIEAGFAEFLKELRRIGSSASASTMIGDVLIPRRLELLGKFEEFRGIVHEELVAAEASHDAETALATRTLLYLLVAAIFFGASVAIVTFRYSLRLDRERQRHFEAIAQANLELENLSARLIETQELERQTLSQELHDEVGQTLTALRMEISQAISALPESDSLDRLRRARHLAEKTVQIVRDISLMLRPSLLDDLGLGPALQWQLERFSGRSGIRYSFEGADAGERLKDPVKTCVFRIAQETLNNCEKYAGATAVCVALQQDSNRLRLEIEDDGRGFNLDARGLPPRGTGILGMKERAQKLGGTLTIDTSPGAGTRLRLALPVEAE